VRAKRRPPHRHEAAEQTQEIDERSRAVASIAPGIYGDRKGRTAALTLVIAPT